jgi:hypothetical protein
MITTATQVFPNNVCSLLVPRMKAIDADLKVYQRALRDSDGTQSVGIFPITWTPDETSYEMNGRPPSLTAAGEPTLQRYVIGVQAFVQDTNEEQGIAVHSILAKRVRSTLYGDPILAVGLNALSVTMNGSTERIQRRGIQVQRYLANEVAGVFMFLSSCEYYVETEIV